MATNMRRFTISVTHNMDMELDKAKREAYYKDTQNEMIRDLIMRGLQNLEAEKSCKRKQVREGVLRRPSTTKLEYPKKLSLCVEE